MNPLKRLTVSALVSLSLAGCLISCKSISPSKPGEQSTVPVSGSASPAPCSIPFSGNFVNDTAGVLDEDAKIKLEQKLDTMKCVGNIDFAAVTLNTTGEKPIADNSLALARCWSIGGQNPDGSGRLMLLAVDVHKWHLQISGSMEKGLTNEEIQYAGIVMTDFLRERNYLEGIDRFVDYITSTLETRRKYTMPANCAVTPSTNRV